MALNLAINLFEAARTHPDKPAWKDGDRRCTYRELNRKALQFGAGLRRLGINPGDRVAMMTPNCLEFPIAYYGILNAGCTVVPFNMLLKTDEVAYHLSDSQARLLIGHVGFQEHARKGWARSSDCQHLVLIGGGEAVGVAGKAVGVAGKAVGIGAGKAVGVAGKAVGENQEVRFDDFVEGQAPLDFPFPTGADDSAAFIYTSGTTGKPKGADLSHSNLFINALLIARLGEFNETDVLPAALPLFHSFGQSAVMNAGLFAGAAIVSFARFDPTEMLDSMEQDGLTMLFGVPTMYQMMLMEAEKRDFHPKIRQALSGGASIAPELIDRIEKRFNTVLLEGYGLSETSPGVTFNLKEKAKPRSVGLPLWGVQVEIHDEQGQPLPPNTPGEVCVRGHNVMKGYHNQPEQTAEVMRNGWFHTGDVGILDEGGYLFIVDRIKDLIIRGGYNVYPREVEDVIYGLDGVQEASVVGVADEILGEEIVACISARQGSQLTEEQVIEWCRSKLAGYKYPRKVVFLDDLPKNTTGKILKKELRKSIS